MTAIRRIRDAIRRAWWAFNAAGGRCPACRKRYPARIEMLLWHWQRDARGWEWCRECFRKHAQEISR